MEELLKVLKKVKPGVDFENNHNLIGNIISAIGTGINEEFDIQITAKDIVPENFNSIEEMYALVEKLEEE